MRPTHLVRGVAASLLALAACHRPPAAGAPDAPIHAAAIDRGAASGSVLSCAVAGAEGGCRSLAKDEDIALPARIKSTRGARAKIDLGGGASFELEGEASVLVTPGARRRLTVEQGAVTVSDAKGLDVAVLDHGIRLDGPAPSTVSVLASAADRATVTVRRGRAELIHEGAQVILAVGDTRRIRFGEALDPKELTDAAPAPAPRSFETERPLPTPRGFGSLAARVPGTRETVGGVRLVSHRVAVTLREGFARTEVEEEFANDTARVLEGTYRFAVPPGSSLSRLALWVGKNLVEGEVVERARAARIFKDIVDDTVRPRDPALLEWSQGGAFSLKIFPIPAHGSRKVVLAYDQALADRGGRTRYVYPMSLGADQAVAADAFSISVTASDPAKPLTEIMTPGYPVDVRTEDHKVVASWSAEKFVPDGDFELSFQRGEGEKASVASYAPGVKEFGDDARAFAAVRVRVDLPEGMTAPAKTRLDRVIVVDASHSQSKASFADEARLAVALLRDLGPEERFVVLACDSACESYPEDGFERGGDDGARRAEEFLSKRAPGGSSDLAGALLEAARRLEGSTAAQAVVIGDGQPTSGELSVDAIAARVRGALDRGHVDIRLLGTGRTIDEVTLGGVARAVGAAYERVGDGQSLAARAADLALGLRRPLVVGARLTMPDGFSDVTPSALPSLKIGDEVLVLARADVMNAKGDVKIEGKLGGAPFALARAIAMPDVASFQNPIVPRLWAEGRIGELEASNDSADDEAIVALSKRFHVASRRTSLLVLENDRMFAAFGIARTTRSAGEQSDHVFGVLGGAPLASSPPDEHPKLAKNDPSAPIANWGEIGLTRPSDPSSARGNMWGSEAGDSFGKGGLGLSGVGEGGGGKGEGIGLGNVGSIGHGAGTGTGTGFGSGHGRLGGSHKTSVPQVRMGASMVSGRLPPEVIQRIVRQNFGRFRLCYEKGLAKDPNLAGRVSVRFMIGRGGSVPVASNAGSDLPDAEVVQCVVSAFRGLTFPEPPEGSGAITVVYPLQFASDGTRPPNPPQATAPPPPERPQDIWPLKPEEIPPKPTAVHRAGDEAWRSADDAALARARAEAQTDGASRKKREALVRALLAHGRFDEALIAAEALAEADPDSAQAGELLAEARAAAGDGPGALAAVDAAAESAPTSTAVHARAARAFEAAGDERRACAHWRSLAELRPSSDADTTEAFRCRARVLGDREGAIAEAKSIVKPGARVTKLVASLEQGTAPAFADVAPQGQLVAKLACDGGERCGTLVVVTPGGTVISPWTPTTSRTDSGEVALASLANGTYRTRLVGAPASTKVTVTMRALGAEKKFDVDTKPGDATVAATVVTNMEWGI